MRRSKAIEALAAMVAERKQREREAREERGRVASQGPSERPSEPASLVNQFAAAHGDFTRDHREGKSPIVRNRGGSAIDRWEASGLLSEPQLAAIAHLQRLWRLVDSGPRLVANLDRAVFGCNGNGNLAEIEARADLHRIRDGFPMAYWNVFENVVRFDEPAGTAGSRLATNQRSAIDAARVVVCLIADMIYMRERLCY